MANRYLFCRHGHDTVEIDIHNYSDPFEDVFLLYWIRILRIIETLLQTINLTFCIVWDTETVKRLPVYGKDVVVLLLMEEFCEIPAYFENVLYVFKPYGFSPFLYLNRANASLSLLVKYTRDLSRWIYRSGVSHLRFRSALAAERGGMVVPLGYGRLTDLPGRPFEERRYLVSFIGSVKQRAYHPLSPRALLGTPKDIARSLMAKQLKSLSERLPGKVLMTETGYYMDGARSDGVSYSEVLAETKICLAPRGSSAETFRLFEAMRQGCVVIGDRVPQHWFLRDCPLVQIDDWRSLERTVADLTGDPARLYDLHTRALAWWDETCSETALAPIMADRLRRETAFGS